jgi:transposase
MARPLLKEIREKIVHSYLRGFGTIAEVADMFDVTSRTVFNYLKMYRENGDLTPKPLPGRPPILNKQNLSIIKTIILSNRDGTLQEFCDEFERQVKIKITIVTMHNACNKLKMKRKKKVFTRRSKIGRM